VEKDHKITMTGGKKLFGLSRNVFFTGLVSFFMDVSSEMIYPVVPLFLANVLGVNKSLIGLIEGVAESTASLLKIFSGWFSDRMGNRKYLMALGYGISALSRPVMATAASWHQIFASRFTDRIGKGIRTAPRDAIIAESVEDTHLARAFSFHRSMDTMGAVIGPALAFLLLGFFSNGYRIVFWLSMIPAVIALFVIFIFIGERRKPSAPSSERPKLTLKHFDWRARCFIAISTIFALGNSSDVFLILRAEEKGVPTAMIPVVYLLFNLVYSLTAIPAGIGADRFGRKRVILLGFMLFGGLYYGFAVAGSARAVWVLFAGYGVFMGLTEGVQKAYLATIIPREFKATAFGVYASAVGLAMLPASLVGGWLWDRVSPAATFYFGAATAGLSALLFIILIAAMRHYPDSTAP
jgi:MFS family permease